MTTIIYSTPILSPRDREVEAAPYKAIDSVIEELTTMIERSNTVLRILNKALGKE